VLAYALRPTAPDPNVRTHVDRLWIRARNHGVDPQVDGTELALDAFRVIPSTCCYPP